MCLTADIVNICTELLLLIHSITDWESRVACCGRKNISAWFSNLTLTGHDFTAFRPERKRAKENEVGEKKKKRRKTNIYKKGHAEPDLFRVKFQMLTAQNSNQIFKKKPKSS